MSTDKEQTLLDKIKDEVAKENGNYKYHRSILNDEFWKIVCERYATEKAKGGSPSPEQLQQIETEYQNRIMNTLMDKWGLSLHRARDIGRDLFYTYVFPVYELGGQFGFKAGYTRSQVEASIAASLERAAENARTITISGDIADTNIIIDKSSIVDKSNHVIV